jgi:hypothetical protein
MHRKTKSKHIKHKHAKRRHAKKHTTRKHKRIMRGGSYREVTYNGLLKNKGGMTVYFPGGFATFDQMKKEIERGDGPNDTA